MAFRMGGGNNRRNDNRSFERGGYGNMNRPDPWGGNNSGGNFRQGPGMNNDVLSLANSLVNTFMRNQPPSLLDLPNRGGYGNRDFGRFDDRLFRGKMNLLRGPPPPYVVMHGMQRNSNQTANFNKNRKANNSKSSVKKEKKESKYADVPNVMFHCHMCKKHMWDATSFENHVKGRTHLMMKDGVEESYRLRANMIRQEAKIEEQLKSIELERLKRMGKAGKGSTRREYCTMCDLHFYGHLSGHRKTEGHLALKKFLHPKCGECGQEFATRIDYDNHLLTPSHMKKAHATRSTRPEKRKNALHISTEEEELKDLKEEKDERKPIRNKREVKEGDEEAMETDDGAEKPAENGEKPEVSVKEEDEEVGDEEAKGEEDEKAIEAASEPEDVILDFKDGDEVPIEIENKIPKYNCNRPLGVSMLHELNCFECHLCGKFFDTAKTAEIHSRTITHHRNFVKFLNEKSNDTKIAQKRAAAALEESERKKRRLEAALNGDDKHDEEDDEKKEDGDETYDPSEATEDDDGKAADETMESQDGDEQFEDANASVKIEKDPEPEPEPEPVKQPEPVIKEEIKVEPPVKEQPAPTPTPPKGTPSNRGRRGRGGRKY